MTLHLSMSEAKTLEEEYFQKFVLALLNKQNQLHHKFPFQINVNWDDFSEVIFIEKKSWNSRTETTLQTIKQLQQFFYSRREQVIEEWSCNMSMADFFRDLEKQVLRTSVFSSWTESIIEEYSLRRREKVCNAIRDRYISPSGRDMLEKAKEEGNSGKATTYDIEQILSHASDPMLYRKIVRLYSKLDNPNNLLRFFQTVKSSNDKNFTLPVMVANIFDWPSFQELLVFFNTFTHKEITKIINSENAALKRAIRIPKVQSIYKAIIRFASNNSNSDKTEIELIQTCLGIDPAFMAQLIQRVQGVQNQETLATFIINFVQFLPKPLDSELRLRWEILKMFWDDTIAELINWYWADSNQLNVLFNRDFNDDFINLSRSMIAWKHREQFIEVLQKSCCRNKVENLFNISTWQGKNSWIRSANRLLKTS